MEAFTARINKAEERIIDIEDQTTENKEAEQRETNNYWTMRGKIEREVIP